MGENLRRTIRVSWLVVLAILHGAHSSQPLHPHMQGGRVNQSCSSSFPGTSKHAGWGPLLSLGGKAVLLVCEVFSPESVCVSVSLAIHIHLDSARR